MPEQATPSLDELHDCAPLRDFVRPLQPGCDVGIRAFDAGGASRLRLAATFVLLLSRHTRRSTIAFVWAIDGPARALTVDAGQTYARLEADLARAIAAPSNHTWPDGQRVPGVLFDAASGSAGLRADLTLRLPADGSAGELCWDRLLFEAISIEPLRRQWAALIAAAGSGPPPDRLPTIDPAERRRVVSDFNQSRLDVPRDVTLAALVEAQARRTPAAVCAVHRERTLTFAALDEAANRLARRLVERGVGAGVHVAIVDERGLDFLIAIVGIWKAGGAYVPVDPGYPEERVRHMLADSEAPVAVVGRSALERHRQALCGSAHLQHLICPSGSHTLPAVNGRLQVCGKAELESCAGTPLPPRCVASDPAYTIYTSGSTGRPKGAIVRHDGAVNHLFAQAHALGADAVARFLQSAPSSSDISVWQFVAPLVFGGTTVIIDDPTDVAAMLRALREHRLGLVELVPALVRWLAAHASGLTPPERALPDLRWMMITGESAPVELVNAWLEVYPDVPVVNAYGPTEASDDVAQAVVRAPLPPRRCTVPIGRPLANSDLYVLDSELEPLPVGVPGEICIAGIGVGNGYWRQPETTARSFVANPFAGGAGPVIYRTGDLGRWKDDGSLECLGRLDHQVQLRGHRIELQEIENVLELHPQVSQAVVRAFHDGRGDGELVAYVVLREGADAGDDDLRDHCARRLPSYMAPTRIVRLVAMPLNPAGKVDRQALVRPRGAADARQPVGAAAEGAEQRTLQRLWQQELGVQGIGVDDDFFALGGDSLSALAIAVGASREGLELRSADVLANPTIARLAVYASSRSATTDRAGAEQAAPIAAVEPLPAGLREAYVAEHEGVESVRPLDPPQLGIFLHALLAADKTAYVDQNLYRIDGALDFPAFADAWQRAAARHEALRTGFVRRGSPVPLQVVLREVAVDVRLLDLSALAADERTQARLAAAQAERGAGFDLARAPLMRLLLVREEPEVHTLVWTHHHLMLDGWSLALVLDEVAAIHDARRSGNSLRLADAVPRSRYSDWIASCDIRPSQAFWREELRGLGDSPAWQLDPPVKPDSGLGMVELETSTAVADALKARAAGSGVTLTTAVQAAWGCVLSGLTGSSDVVFGVVTSGRELPVEGIAEMVGLFVTTLPLRIDTAPSSEPELGAWLGQLQRRAAIIRGHEAVPVGHIARWVGIGPGESLFDSLFVMANYPSPTSTADGLRLRSIGFRTMPAYPLSLIVTPGATLGLRLVHDRRVLDQPQALALGLELTHALEALAAGRDPRPGS